MATQYRIQIATDSGYTSLVKNELTSDLITVFDTLDSNTNYYVRARKETDLGFSDWSEYGSNPIITLYPLTNLKALYNYESYGVNDVSGNGYTATLFGGASISSGVITFGNNTTDYMRIPSSVLNGATDFTFACECKIDTLHNGSGYLNTVLSGAQGAFPSDGEVLFTYSKIDSDWRQSIDSTVASTLCGIGNGIEDGNYHKIAFARSGANLKCYFDGVLMNTVTVSSGTLSIATNGLLIGQEQDSVGGGFDANQCFAGKLKGNIYFYTRALSDSEIAIL